MEAHAFLVMLEAALVLSKLYSSALGAISAMVAAVYGPDATIHSPSAPARSPGSSCIPAQTLAIFSTQCNL